VLAFGSKLMEMGLLDFNVYVTYTLLAKMTTSADQARNERMNFNRNQNYGKCPA
jgi:hypothetical protein